MFIFRQPGSYLTFISARVFLMFRKWNYQFPLDRKNSSFRFENKNHSWPYYPEKFPPNPTTEKHRFMICLSPNGNLSILR